MANESFHVLSTALCCPGDISVAIFIRIIDPNERAHFARLTQLKEPTEPEVLTFQRLRLLVRRFCFYFFLVHRDFEYSCCAVPFFLV